MKKIRKHKLALRHETIRMLDAQLANVVGGATNTGGNTLQVCVDTDLATNCLCGGYTNGCTLVSFSCDATTRVIC